MEDGGTVQRDVLKERFESRRRKCLLSFEEIEALLANPRHTLQDIATQAGITRQGVSLILHRYFAHATGEARRRERRQQKRRDGARSFTISSARGFVAVAAEREELPVEACDRSDHSWHRKRLRINGRICGVMIAQKARRNGYYRFGVGLGQIERYDFLIVCVGRDQERRILAIPTSILREQFHADHKRMTFCVPVEQRRPVYNNIRPKVAWEQYENAWHLLKA